MSVQFGMRKNVGQKMICRTCSMNPKNIFGQNVGKVVRLTQHADIAFLHQNVVQLPNMMTMPKTGIPNLPTSGAKIFASNISQHIGKVYPRQRVYFDNNKKIQFNYNTIN